MNKSSNIVSNVKKIFAVLVFSLITYSGYSTWSAYQYSKSSSPFEMGACRLGSYGLALLQSPKGQEDLLCMLHLNGSLNLERVWHDLHGMGQINDPKRAFQSISNALFVAGANQEDSGLLNLKSLRKNFLKDSGLDAQDAADLILYMVQNSFNRKIGQERYEIALHQWTQESKDAYLKAARGLHLIDRIEPKQQVYHQCWVCGASRLGLLKRLIDTEYMLNKKGIKITDKKYDLTGNRELWANIDGIEPSIRAALLKAKEEKLDLDEFSVVSHAGESRTLEGKEYIEYLAKINGVTLNLTKPFVSCEDANQCAVGRFPGREYPNYQGKVEKRLNETLMVKDLINSFFPDKQFYLIDSPGIDGKRPDTLSTTMEAAQNLAREISEGKFGEEKSFQIFYQSNNPFIERQALVAQQAIDEALKEFHLDSKGIRVTVEGVGFACNDGSPELIAAELAALIAEKWQLCKKHDAISGVHPKRDIANLLFQKRSNDVTVPLLPVFKSGWSLKGWLVAFWDNR